MTENQNTGEPVNPFINLNIHKAGLNGLDQDKINKIIQEASKESRFHSFQLERTKRIDGQVNNLKAIWDKTSESDKELATKKADILILELEQYRILNKIIVHFDMDMFFAAVEIKKNPSLADKPMAVGSLSMISTSNYIARKYGVRSAMAGFIAKKLCPQLILIKPNFKDYCKESRLVMKIINEYDVNMQSFSLDEVYIDLTDYVFKEYCLKNNISMDQLKNLNELNDDIWLLAYNIVNEIRARVYNECQLTISAGISCNTMLAKVCTDIKKPNGQFMVKGHREEIMNFVSDTNIRKFPGIGPVRGRILESFNIHKASDLFTNRALLLTLFSELNIYYYFRIYLGIGSSEMHNDDRMQKSHSREITVGSVSDFNKMCNLLQKISAHVSDDLKHHSQLCKTVTLKLKKISFEVFIKSHTLNLFTDDKQIIFNVGKQLLSQEVAKSPNTEYRLIGLKVSNLKEYDDLNENIQLTLSQFFKPKSSINNNQSEMNSELTDNETMISDDEDIDIFLSTSGDISKTENQNVNECDTINDILENFDETIVNNTVSNGTELSEWQFLKCPICQTNTLFNNNEEMNRHIDICLNRNVCIELTKITNIDDNLTNNGENNQCNMDITINKCTESPKKSNKKRNNKNSLSINKIDRYFKK